MHILTTRCAGIALGLAPAVLPMLLAVASFIFGFGVLLTGSGGAVPVIVFLFVLNVLVARLSVRRLSPLAR